MPILKRLPAALVSLALVAAILVLPASAVGSVGVRIDGIPVAFDETYGVPFIDSAHRTQVPFRLTLETFGCTVTWEEDTRTAVAEKDGVTVRVPIGQPYIQVDGTQQPIDTAAIIVDDRTYLPIRAVLEAFGAKVSWDRIQRQVLVLSDPGWLQVHFIDVGQGDAALIDLGETEILIDGGDNRAGPRVVSYLEPYVEGKLDYIIATHPDYDHIGGLDNVLAAYEVGEVIDSGWTKDTQSFLDYWAALQAEPGLIFSPDQDRTIPLGENASLEILETGDDWAAVNDASVIARLDFGTLSVLFTGDMTRTAEEAALDRFGDVDVLKVGHHGSYTSTGEPFLDAVTPETAVISYLRGNSYHHPNPRVLQRLLDRGIHVCGTGKSGDLILTSDGQTYWFSTGETLTMEDAG